MPRTDPAQGSTCRPGMLKGLGMVGAVCRSHTDLEKQYVSLRQVVGSDHQEKRRRVMEEGVRARVGGRVELEQQLLDTLARRFPPGGTEAKDGPETERAHKDSGDIAAAEADTDQATTPAQPPLSQPTGPPHTLSPPNHSPPASNQASVPPRDPEGGQGGDLMMGSREQGSPGGTCGLVGPPTTTTSPPRHSPDPPSSSNALPQDRHLAEMFIGHPKDGHFIADTSWVRPKDYHPVELPKGRLKDFSPVDGPRDRPEDIVLTVEKKPLSWRSAEKAAKKEPELERGFDVIRRVNQHYPDPKPDTEPRTETSRRLDPPPRVASPLEVRSTPTSRQTGRWSVHRGKAGLTPEVTKRRDVVPMNAKPPSPTFQPTGLGTVNDRKAALWKPLVSRLGHDPFAELPEGGEGEEEGEEEVEGRSTVTHTSSKVILSVVLPRTVKSREGRLCGRQGPSPRQQSAHFWLSSAPPPPPPPSAPTDTHNEALDDDGDQWGVQGEEGGGRAVHPRAWDLSDAASTREKHSPPDRKQRDAGIADATDSPRSTSPRVYSTTSKSPVAADEQHEITPRVLVAAVPPLDLEPRRVTTTAAAAAESTTFQTPVPGGVPLSPQSPSSCHHAAYCALLGPQLCPDCESVRFRRQSLARHDLLYPRIDVFPRYMVASQKLQAAMGGGRPSQLLLPRLNGPGPSGPHWPYTSDSGLRDVVTPLDLCRRIAQKSHAAGLSMGQ
ncbi:uncharacterized protein LOC143282631 isoform X2 [Babylonia areolata]